jgi:hypothetical protein
MPVGPLLKHTLRLTPQSASEVLGAFLGLLLARINQLLDLWLEIKYSRWETPGRQFGSSSCLANAADDENGWPVPRTVEAEDFS